MGEGIEAVEIAMHKHLLSGIDDSLRQLNGQGLAELATHNPSGAYAVLRAGVIKYAESTESIEGSFAATRTDDGEQATTGLAKQSIAAHLPEPDTQAVEVVLSTFSRRAHRGLISIREPGAWGDGPVPTQLIRFQVVPPNLGP
ncbi:MAG TPA: hypothetical protein VK674_04025 [Candidatus Limnocylindria bacterium]|nr:hypothetical protein [Candidatus Limnocylindria bacterium]